MDELKDYLIEKIRQYNEEEHQGRLIVFDDAIQHMLIIDRVLRQPLGHLLLIGNAGIGKTVFT